MLDTDHREAERIAKMLADNPDAYPEQNEWRSGNNSAKIPLIKKVRNEHHSTLGTALAAVEMYSLSFVKDQKSSEVTPAPTGPCEGDLQVWWIAQTPGKPFTVYVDTAEEGIRLLEVLASYDLFQLAQNIKPDFSNVGGLNVYEDGEWCDWESPDGEGERAFRDTLITATGWDPLRFCWSWKEKP